MFPIYSLWKIFEKPPPFEQIKVILSNGYLLFRCKTHDAMQRLLFNGPWAVNEIVLQLAPWQSFFEPVFIKLTIVDIWVQLHNLLVKFWNGDSLEIIASHLG